MPISRFEVNLVFKALAIGLAFTLSTQVTAQQPARDSDSSSPELETRPEVPDPLEEGPLTPPTLRQEITPIGGSDVSLNAHLPADAGSIPIPELPVLSKDAESDRPLSDAALAKIFETSDYLETFGEVPSTLTIRVRRIVFSANPSQNPHPRSVVWPGTLLQESGEKVEPHGVVYETQTVNPRAEDLSPEQRLGVIVTLQNQLIERAHRQLLEAKGDSARNELLEELGAIYADRFDIDTKYQDYKVRRIEARAAKLRADVTARERAAKEWVDAMVTLAKMRANGIETMPAVGPPAEASRLAVPDELNVAPSFAPANSSGRDIRRPATFERR